MPVPSRPMTDGDPPFEPDANRSAAPLRLVGADGESDREPRREPERAWREAYGLAWALLGDAHRAEELAQDAFLRLRDRAPEDGAPPRALLLKTVRHLAIDERRRRSPAGLGEEAEGHLGAGEPVDSADPALRAEVREQRERLHAALAGLDATWRAVLYLRDGLSLSYREVGEALGKSEDVVRVTLHRARRRVRHVLMADEPEGEFS